MTDIIKPRYRVKAGGALSQEQATDLRGKTFYNHLLRTDTDEILKKAGVSRHALKTLLTDPDIEQAVDRRKQELGNTAYTITPSEGKVADFIYEQLDLHKGSILQASMLSKLYGYDVPEMIWGTDKSGRNAVTEFTSKPLQWFEPLAGGQLQWFPNDGSTPVMISEQDNFYYKYMLLQNNPTYLNPKGDSILSRVYWLHYFKINAFRFWSKYLERFGSPLVIGNSDAQSLEDAQDFSDALLGAHSAGVITIGMDEKVTTVGATGSGEAFVSYHKTVKESLATYLLGQTLTSGTDKGGTYGQGKVHQDQQEIIFSSDRNHAVNPMQGFIDRICLANGFEPPEFKWVAKKFVDHDQLDADKKVHEMGVRFNKSYFVDEHGYNEQHISHMDYGDSAIKLPTSAQSNRYASIASKTWLPFKAADGDNKFTPEQMELEQVADDALNTSAQPFDTNAVLSAISDATDADSLRESLFNLCGEGLAESDFNQLVYTAVMVADVHGLTDESSEV